MRTTHALALAGLLVVMSSPAVAQKQKKVSQKEISRELREMEEEEQREQANWESMTDEEFAAAQMRRKERTREIVAAGWLDKTADFYNAGMLLQHGQEPDDFLLAHILGTVAALDGDAGGKFLSAAALDRFLLNVDQPQYFMSQFGDEFGKEPREPFDDTLSQVVVDVFQKRTSRGGLRGRDVDKDDRKKKELKRVSKKLKKQAEAALEFLAKEDPEDAERIAITIMAEGALYYVEHGQLSDADDLLNAALAVSVGPGARHQTLAHILAIAAAIEGHKEAKPLVASTLDGLLAALERAPVFGTEEAATTEGALVLHANVKKPFLGKGKRR